MPFSNTDFLFLFLPVFLIAYALLPARNALYLGFSVFFYFVGEGWYLGVVIASMVANYGFGLLIDRAEHRRRLAVSIAVGANLLSLVVFKYLGFLSVSLLGVAPDSRLATIHLPLGISFFTFHAISYLVDVYRRDVRAERSFVDLSLYMMMFPQLISGPILRFHLIAPQLRKRIVNAQKVYFGACLFCLGLAQKVLLADTLAGICDPLFSHWRSLSTATAWLAAVTYTLQIYFDFGGYSNMAIGLGWATGFFYPRNFDYPYISQSITEFWRRWHMSLSRRFRDYLYVPLGGNRHGPAKTYRNLIVVFLLCGVWHGASWTFVLWGIYHGALLVLERLGLGRVLEAAPRPARHLYAMAAVIFGWVLFRADSLKQIGFMMRRMIVVGPTHDVDILYHLSHSEIVTIVIAMAASTPILARLVGQAAVLPSMPPWDEVRPAWAYWTGGLIALVLFVAASIKVISGAYSPFIYFRF